MNMAARQAFLSPSPQRRPPDRRRAVTSLPLPPQASPRWLVALLLLHRYSLLATLGLATCTFSVYGWSVYSQQTWANQYRQLEQLRRDERQLTSVNAALYGQLTQRAQEQPAGLVLQKPSKTLFLPPEPQRPWQTPKAADPGSEPSSPVGY